MTEGRLVSALGFGFWVSLCKRSYEQGAGGPRLWPELAMRGFPHLPRTQRTRSQVFHALDPLRDLRNRVSHHEAVWDRRLDRSHRDIVETIGWINRDLAATLQAHSPLPTVLDRGVAGFRSQAEGTIATGLPRRRRTAAVPLRMPEPPEAEDLLAPPAAPVGNDGADAESFVAKVLRSQGWTVAFYTNRRGYGFDLWARRENRAMVIEVKSSLAGLGTVSLTPTEYEAARRHGDSYFLALVEHVASASPQLRMIQNPAAKLKMEKRATDSYVIPRSEWVRAMD